MKDYADVDAYLADDPLWRDETAAVRAILLDCGLDETIKWGKPTYLHGEDNLCILQPFRDFLACMFFKGVLLDDPEGVLEEQGQNTHAARRVCFTGPDSVETLTPTLRALVAEAIRVEEEGLPLPPRPATEWAEELIDALDADPALLEGWESLTPGRQREYNLHIAGAKKAETRTARVQKHAAKIRAGKGLRDR